MPTVIVSGSAGLIGSESARHFAAEGFDVVGIDNDLRAHFFGEAASTAWNRRRLQEQLGGRYHHVSLDIRDRDGIEPLFAEYSSDIALVVHAAAQPSHDWAARDPHTDFSVNAGGTLTLLEATRRHAPRAVFIFTSTNKVYGDRPNELPLIELPTRWDLPEDHPSWNGIDESMSIDRSTHSVFGASKVAADVMVQEYGRYFGLHTGTFRGGCLTGPSHSGAPLHGFLAYLMRCAVRSEPYTILGYRGKQVRDNIHSRDLVTAFAEFFRNPRPGEVYNIGGSRHSNCSMQEAIAACERITGKPMKTTYAEDNRIGDHIWYVSDVSRFRSHYPEWRYDYDLEAILTELYAAELEKDAVLGYS
jgi:CDP-paratose 2-epimerase